MLEIFVYEEGGSARVDAVEPEQAAVQMVRPSCVV
jgi:hypothetical protein